MDVIKSALTDLKDNIKTMSENEKKNEQPDSVIDIVEETLKFNRQNQEGKGLKVQIKFLVDYQLL